mgnify:CR=1 FL=1
MDILKPPVFYQCLNEVSAAGHRCKIRFIDLYLIFRFHPCLFDLCGPGFEAQTSLNSSLVNLIVLQQYQIARNHTQASVT